MITGKEALIALANGEDVEWNSKGFSGENWHSVLSSPHTKIGAVEILKCEYGNDDVGYYSDVLFRLKPRTITIGNTEVPAPFEPHEFEDCYILSDLYKHGYTKSSWKYSKSVPSWRSEDEIKQVVAALRSVFNVK